jgi:hypothetical protein
MANICKNLESDLKFILNNEIIIMYKDKNINTVTTEKCEVLALWYNCQFHSINLPIKKLINADYIYKKINKKSDIIDCKKEFKKVSDIIFNETNIKSETTSYGLGFDMLFRSHKNLHNTKDIILKKMSELGLKSSFNVSDASWVLRIKISKSKENLQIIKKL